MTDTVSQFYSGPSGYQRNDMKQMGGGPMSSLGKFSVPLWKRVQKRISELVPQAVDAVNRKTLAQKKSKDIRGIESDSIISPKDEINESKIVRFKAKSKRNKKKRRRISKHDYDSDDEQPKYKRLKRRQSHIASVLGDDTY